MRQINASDDRLFLRSKNGSPDRLIGNPIILCDIAQRFLILNDTTYNRRPFLGRNLIARFDGTGMPFCDCRQKGMTSVSLIVLEQLLEFPLSKTGGG